MITAPLLAGSLKEKDWENIKYPVLATPKLDGIRALKVDGKLLTRSFKPVPNRYIREVLQDLLPDGFDGEIMIKNSSFNEVQSAVMSVDGCPDFYYCVFDYVKDSLNKPYIERMKDLNVYSREQIRYDNSIDSAHDTYKAGEFIRYLFPKQINNIDELSLFEEECLSKGYEGAMIRSPEGKYKCGRSTVKEGIILKIKRFISEEAVIIGFDELFINNNEKTKDELGHSKRSSHQENLVSGNTLGALVVRSQNFGDFNIGSGLTEKIRKEIWENREYYLGKMVTFEYLPIGMKDKPRHPVFKAVRDPRDY